MSGLLTQDVIDAIEAKDSIKVVATISKEGIPHVAVKGSITLTEDGRIRFLEYLEKSQTQKNLVYAIWFQKQIAVNIITADGRSYQIKGVPERTVNAGREFLDEYQKVQDKFGRDFDLSSIWYINVESVEEESLFVRREKLEALYPNEIHVDRIAKDEYRR
ncbi:MAG: hypothetical protein ACI4HQ_13085 [Acetatifactor sp.]